MQRSGLLFLVFVMFLSTIVFGADFVAKQGSNQDLKPDGSLVPKLRVNIDTMKTCEPISKYIYGQFIEHLGRCIYGGIWAEMLEDRKFYFPITADYSPWETIEQGAAYKVIAASPWKIIGPAGNVKMLIENPYVGQHSPQIELSGNGAAGGICQGDLGLVKNKRYSGRVVIAGQPEACPIKVSLIWGEGEKNRHTFTINKLSDDFTTIPFSFKADAAADNGQLEITGYGKGRFVIGAVSLMPADNIKGFRQDTLALLKELNSPVYRWPGGNFVSGYNWKDGIGDPDKRPPRQNPAWKGVEHNDVGIDEFMTFCQLIDAEPYIAVNTGLGTAEDVRYEVEYCNGLSDTPMGKLRTQNGHTAPYKVRWWAVGNEMYGAWQLGHMPLEEYTKKHNKVVDAMREVDADIKVIGVGKVGDWSRQMLTHCSDRMDLISEHFYEGKRRDICAHVKQITDSVKEIAQEHYKYRKTIDSLKGKDIRIAMDEWNYWYGPHLYGELGVRYFMKDAVGIAAGLHECFRNSDIIFMANYAQTVNVIGCIKTDKTNAAFETTGLVLKLYRNNFGVIPVVVEGDYLPLDVAAAFTEDSKAITIAVVNPTLEKKNLEIGIENVKLQNNGRLWLIANPDPMAYNEPGKKAQVVIKEKSSVKLDSDTFIPPLSISLYRFAVR